MPEEEPALGNGPLSLSAALDHLPEYERYPDVALLLCEAVASGDIQISFDRWHVLGPYRVKTDEGADALQFGPQSELFWNLVASRLGSGIEVDGRFSRFQPAQGDFDASVGIGIDDRVVFEVRNLRLNQADVLSAISARADGNSSAALLPIATSSNELRSRAPVNAGRARRGRTKGSGMFDDEPFLDDIERLLNSREAKSLHDAAKSIAHNAKGASIDSTISRLMRKYKESGKRY